MYLSLSLFRFVGKDMKIMNKLFRIVHYKYMCFFLLLT